MTTQDDLTGARLHRRPLHLEAHFVGERRPRVHHVEALGNDGDEEDGDGEDEGEPEVGCRHEVARRADVRVAEEVRVEDEREAEVEEDAAPHYHVVEDRPIARLQGTLQMKGNEHLNELSF